MKKIKIAIVFVILVIIALFIFLVFNNTNSELQTVKSEKQLSDIYKGNKSELKDIVINGLTMPFSFLENAWSSRYYYNKANIAGDYATESTTRSGLSPNSYSEASLENSSKDYSTTNIQVENVDEADITKTDGNYIYSISDNNVIITNVMNPSEIKIEATIKSNDGSIPEDLILYKDKLIVISSLNTNTNLYSYYSYYRENNTEVKIYNISTKSNPILIKSYELYEPYYTSRCIDNQLYVISSGKLREQNNKIIHAYKEDRVELEIPLEKIKYLKEVDTKVQTLVSSVNLDNINPKVNIDSYLIDISNAYVSQNSIYLLNEKYHYDTDYPQLSDIFGLKGIIGAFTYDDKKSDNFSGYKSEIYKFNILTDGQVVYSAKNTIDGKTINQYSLDEQNKHLRIALYDNNGARVVILDQNLNLIGNTNYVAKGEKMYSSRFMGNKVYLVTYRTMDPLFVIDLTNETAPKVLGELHIPGYSTYLHPYDENHLIGIGMETEEVTNRDSFGRIISTTSKIIGMKMALFDVSNVNNPMQISQTVIGDRRTTSAILTNPKALLFSKEKQLIAIPVNNYSTDFEINTSSDQYLDVINSYTNYAKNYIAEGYFVYNINLTEGFKLKGVITHDSNINKNRYSYYNQSKMLRGLYIGNNLYTISESAIKVNALDNLELIKELKIEK